MGGEEGSVCSVRFDGSIKGRSRRMESVSIGISREWRVPVIVGG